MMAKETGHRVTVQCCVCGHPHCVASTCGSIAQAIRKALKRAGYDTACVWDAPTMPADWCSDAIPEADALAAHVMRHGGGRTVTESQRAQVLREAGLNPVGVGVGGMVWA